MSVWINIYILVSKTIFPISFLFCILSFYPSSRIKTVLAISGFSGHYIHGPYTLLPGRLYMYTYMTICVCIFLVLCLTWGMLTLVISLWNRASYRGWSLRSGFQKGQVWWWPFSWLYRLLTSPNHLLKASPPDTITLGIKFQYMNLSGWHKHSGYIRTYFWNTNFWMKKLKIEILQFLPCVSDI